MSPVQIITDLLRSLPSKVRRTLYTVLAVLGLALAFADWPASPRSARSR